MSEFASPSVAGKVAIITGAGNGIGQVTAEFLAQQGASVVVADIDVAAAEKTTATITGDGGTATAVEIDVTDPEKVQRAVDEVVSTYGRIDILHNNAAATSANIVGKDFDVLTTDLDIWNTSFKVNLTGPMLVCKSVVPVMIEGGGGSIINMSSGAGLSPTAGVYLSYSTSKSAIEMLTRHVASSHGKQGIRCNAIAPGTILTETHKSQIPPDALERALARCMTTRLGESIDIAQLVAFLGSDASGYLTGQIISVDGGSLAHSPASH